MYLEIHSLQKTLFSGDVTSVTLPTTAGEITILDHHIPLISILKPGTITIIDNTGKKNSLPIQEGFVEVRLDCVIILTTALDRSVATSHASLSQY